MRKIHMLAAALAGAVFALPALAAPNLAGTSWTAGGECLRIAFEFRADFSFIEYDPYSEVFEGDELPGGWRLDAGTLYLQYDNGYSVQTPISDHLFVLSYTLQSGKRVTCEFTPESD